MEKITIGEQGWQYLFAAWRAWQEDDRAQANKNLALALTCVLYMEPEKEETLLHGKEPLLAAIVRMSSQMEKGEW